MKKDESLTKKVSSIVLSILLVGLTTLLIFYFLNLQIEYSYQYNKSIGKDFNQAFATTSNPNSIATDSAGNVYVLDPTNDKVQKYTTNGIFVNEWNIKRTSASNLNPNSIATDSAGNVYVLEIENDKVQKYTTNGTFVNEWNIN